MKIVEDTLKTILGYSVKVISIEKINNKTDIHASRVIFYFKKGLKSSIIIKHLPWDNKDLLSDQRCHPDLKNEIISYKFLAKCIDFTQYPHYLGSLGNVLVIEDLNKDDINLENELTAQKTLLSTFASLHATTINMNDFHNQLLKDSGLSEDKYIMKCYNDIPYHFEVGLTFLKELMKLYSIEGDLKECSNILKILEHPGDYLSFLHNDFASRRHSLFVNNNFYLIDFEHSRFGHAFLDFWRIYLGKIEFNHKTGYYFLKRIEYLDGMKEWYQREFTRLHSGSLKNWDYNMDAMLLSIAFSRIGKLVKIPEYIKEQNMELRPSTPLFKDIYNIIILTKRCASGKYFNSTLYIISELLTVLEKSLQLFSLEESFGGLHE